MDQFRDHLFEADGDSGYPYRLWRQDGENFDMADLNLARDTITKLGGEVVMGALDSWGDHHDGVVRVRPELGEEAKQQLGAVGIGETHITPVLQ